MNKKEVLTKLAELKLDVKAMEKFKGQAQLIKKIDKSIRYITKFKSDQGLENRRDRFWLIAHTDNEGESGFQVNEKMEGALAPWDEYPDNARMDDGSTRRMDRFKASGNGQVPKVVATAWQLLSQDFSISSTNSNSVCSGRSGMFINDNLFKQTF